MFFLSSFRTVLSAIHRVWIIQTQVGALLVWKSTWKKRGPSWTAKSRVSWTVSVYRSDRHLAYTLRVHLQCVSVTVLSAILHVCIWILESQVGALLVWKSTWEKRVLCTAKKVPKQKKNESSNEKHIHRSRFQPAMPRTSFPGHNCANGLLGNCSSGISQWKELSQRPLKTIPFALRYS